MAPRAARYGSPSASPRLLPEQVQVLQVLVRAGLVSLANVWNCKEGLGEWGFLVAHTGPVRCGLSLSALA